MTEGCSEDGNGADIGKMDDDTFVEEAEDVRRRRPAASPTEAEVRAHRATHLPFRNWCPECVAGRAKDWPHPSKGKSKISEVPEAHFDYCFLRNRQGGESVPVLVGKDVEKKLFMAHVVPCKGTDFEWVAKQVCKDLRKLGIHGDVKLRGDQEPAIQDLLNEVARARNPARTIIEPTPQGDSSANGVAERAVQSLEEMVRVHKLALETRIGCRLEVSQSIFSWLVEHAADILNKFVVGADGRTAFQRLKGRKYTGTVLEFCSPVMFRVSGKVQGGLMTERWYEGLWLGKRFDTEEHLVMKDDGFVVRCRAVRERDIPVTKEMLEKLKSTPSDPTGTMKPVESVPRAVMTGVDKKESEGFVPKRITISRAAMNKFGVTERCRKCRNIASGGSERSGSHSEECRRRFEELMKSDEEFKEKLEENEDKRNKYLAGEVEACDAKRPRTGNADVLPAAGGSSSSSSGQGTHRQPTETEPDVPLATPEVVMPDEVPTLENNGHVKQARSLVSNDDGDCDQRRAVRRRLDCIIAAVHGCDEQMHSEGIVLDAEETECWEQCESAGVYAYDSASVRRAKQEELDRFSKMNVYEVVRREDATRRWGSNIIGVRWVLTPKSYGLKARLVAKEFASKKIDRDTLFAGTPSLGALRLLISRVAAEWSSGVMMMTADIKTAFLYASMKRDVLIELPPEDVHSQSGDYVGHLLRAMYGTRDAPQQ